MGVSSYHRHSRTHPIITAPARHSRAGGNPNPYVQGTLGLAGYDVDSGCFHFGSPKVPHQLLLARADRGFDSRLRENDENRLWEADIHKLTTRPEMVTHIREGRESSKFVQD